jgi:hypothetical protein
MGHTMTIVTIQPDLERAAPGHRPIHNEAERRISQVSGVKTDKAGASWQDIAAPQKQERSARDYDAEGGAEHGETSPLIHPSEISKPQQEWQSYQYRPANRQSHNGPDHTSSGRSG